MAKTTGKLQMSPTELLAVRNVADRAISASQEEDRTGIAAAIVSGERILEIAENEVKAFGDPTKHAEMVVIAAVTQQLNRKQLAECTLISSLQPCEMCLAAMRFSGIGRLIFLARQENVAAKYFVFPALRITDFQRAGESFAYAGGVLEDEVIHLYKDGDE